MKLIMIFLLLCLTTLLGETFSKEMNDILKLVMNANGYLTKEIHTKFWQEMNQKGVYDDAYNAKLKDSLLVGQELQRAIWSDIQKSIQANKKIISPKTLELLENMKTINPDAYKKANDGFLTLQEHAIKKIPLERDGEKSYITEDMTKKVILGLDAGFERLDTLFHKRWNPQPKERQLTPNFKVLFEFPFIMDEPQFVKDIKLTNYTSIIDETTGISIVHSKKMSDVNYNFDKESAAHCVKQSLSTNGILNPIVLEKVFRGKSSAYSQYSVLADGKKVYGVVQCILNTDEMYVVSIIGADAVKTNILFSDFLERISLK